MSAHHVYRRTATLSMALLAFVMGSHAVRADDIQVCWDGSGHYRTIQEGIDAAIHGDQVIVCDGVYSGPGNRDLHFDGKRITVRSANGPDSCVIDCQHSGRGFYFAAGETSESIVSGFTIASGFAADGGAIYCVGSSPTIRNCTLVHTENVIRLRRSGERWGG